MPTKTSKELEHELDQLIEFIETELSSGKRPSLIVMSNLAQAKAIRLFVSRFPVAAPKSPLGFPGKKE